MMKQIPPQSGVCLLLKSGQSLEVRDPEGAQVSDLFCVDHNNLKNYFSAGRTIDYNDGLFLSVGGKLYSNSSDVLMTVIEDTCGVHDLLMPPCSLKMFQIVAENSEYHPSCHENLVKNFATHDVPGHLISSSFNIFMNVSVGEGGRVQINKPISKAGDYVVLRAERDLIVGLTACSHEQTNDLSCKPIEYEILMA